MSPTTFLFQRVEERDSPHSLKYFQISALFKGADLIEEGGGGLLKFK